MNTKCNHKWCIKCREKWNKGHKKKWKGKSKLEMTVKKIDNKKNKTKKCPTCNNLITKNKGCDHMICRMCGSNFCWICNTVYPFDEEINQLIFGCEC
jgi:hypothetical protein